MKQFKVSALIYDEHFSIPETTAQLYRGLRNIDKVIRDMRIGETIKIKREY